MQNHEVLNLNKIFFIFFSFFILGCSVPGETSIYVKDVLRLNGSVSNVASYSILGTGFIIKKLKLQKEGHLSQEDSLKASDLLFVTNFHNACCDSSGRFYKMFVEPNIETIESVPLNTVCGISVENDLIVYCLDDDFPLEKLVESSKVFDQQIEQLSENGFSIYLLGFSGIRSAYSWKINNRKERLSSLSEMVTNSFNAESFYLLSQSVGYSTLFLPGMSGGPVLDVKSKELRGVINSTIALGRNRAISLPMLSKILQHPIECSNTHGDCIDLGLKEAFERAQKGDQFARLELFKGEKGGRLNWIEIMCHRRLLENFGETCDKHNLDQLKYDWFLGAAQSGHPEAEEGFFVTYFTEEQNDESLKTLALDFLRYAVNKVFLSSKYRARGMCQSNPSLNDSILCPKDSSLNWGWLKTLAGFGHIEAQKSLADFFTCGTNASFADCNDQEAEKILTRLCHENKDLQEIKLLKDNSDHPLSVFIRETFDRAEGSQRVNPVKEEINKIYKRFFGNEDETPGICI